MEISLRPIDENNFIEAFNLKLAEGQEKFVSNPIRSLAQAYVYRNQSVPFGIYNGDVMVGYVMVIYDYDIFEYNIWHMMIDEKFQNQGFGKAALQSCLEYIEKSHLEIQTELFSLVIKRIRQHSIYMNHLDFVIQVK